MKLIKVLVLGFATAKNIFAGTVEKS